MEPTTIFIIAQTIWDLGLIFFGAWLVANCIAIALMVFDPEEQGIHENTQYAAVRIARSIRGYLRTDNN